MNMEDIDKLTDPATFNREFLDRLENADETGLKKAAAAQSKMLRIHLREEGFLRKILPPVTLTNDDLNRTLAHDRPFRIEDMEPSSKGAMCIPFGVGTDIQLFYGRKFAIEFFRVATPTYAKSIDELRTYTMDLRQVINDNMLNDIHTAEDGYFMSAIDAIVGPIAGAASAISGVVQHHTISGGITTDTYPEAQKYLENFRLNNGVFLMNRATAKEFNKWDRNELGGDMRQKVFKEGLNGIGDSTILGVPHIFTMKNELVADNTVYCFTEPNFFGRFYMLQDVTMHIERKKDMLYFSAYETIGIAVPNFYGVQKVVFTA